MQSFQSISNADVKELICFIRKLMKSKIYNYICALKHTNDISEYMYCERKQNYKEKYNFNFQIPKNNELLILS